MSANNLPLNNLFNNLSSEVDYIQEIFPNAEVIIPGDFNTHNNQKKQTTLY